MVWERWFKFQPLEPPRCSIVGNFDGVKTMDEIEAHKDGNSKKVEIYDDNIRNECQD